MIKCNECKYLHFSLWHEYSIPVNFIEPPVDDGPSLMFREYSGRICRHPVCFITETYTNPTDGEQTFTRRVSGQGLLNRDNKCKYFKPNLWTKFKKWIRRK